MSVIVAILIPGKTDFFVKEYYHWQWGSFLMIKNSCNQNNK